LASRNFLDFKSETFWGSCFLIVGNREAEIVFASRKGPDFKGETVLDLAGKS